MYEFSEKDLTAFRKLSATGKMTEDALQAFGEYLEGCADRVDLLFSELTDHGFVSYYNFDNCGIRASYRDGHVYTQKYIPFALFLDDTAVEKIKEQKKLERIKEREKHQLLGEQRKKKEAEAVEETAAFARFKKYEKVEKIYKDAGECGSLC